jgi:hypothetical protein
MSLIKLAGTKATRWDAIGPLEHVLRRSAVYLTPVETRLNHFDSIPKHSWLPSRSLTSKSLMPYGSPSVRSGLGRRVILTLGTERPRP